MKCPIVFRPNARLDVLDACAWYEERNPGLGSRFERSLERTLEKIAESPVLYPTVHRDVHRALLHVFPYAVFYRIRDEVVHVLAVMHGRRDPEHWKSRADVE